MRKITLLVISFILGIAVILVAITAINNDYQKSVQVVNNTQVKAEINSLLIPLENKNITESDFDNLKSLTRGDDYAKSEVNELSLLARYKEYSHVGHGLGFLFEYVDTGKQPVCPGHLLSHYYVFKKHGENAIAKSNLDEAKSSIKEWNDVWQSKNSSYQQAENITYYKQLFDLTIIKIDAGNSQASEEDISTLSEAPCLPHD